MAVFLLIGMVFLSSIFALQGSLLSEIIASFDLKSSAQGLPNTAAFAGGVVSLLIAFLVSARLRKWLMFAFAVAVSAVCLLILSGSASFGVFVAVWFVLGLGIGWLDTLLSACMADLYQGRTLTRMMSLLHTFFGAASMLAPLLFDRMLRAGSAWREAYLPVAGLGAGLLVLFCAGAAASGTLRAALTKPAGATGGGLAESVRRGRLLHLMAAMFFHGIFLSGLNTWINRFADSLASGAAAMPAMSFLFFGVLISRLIMPYIPIRPERYVRCACIASGCVLLAGVFSGNRTALCACTLTCGILFGAVLPYLLAMACSRLPESTLTATTALMLSYYLGEAVASPLVGALESAVSLSAGMCALGAAMFASGLMCVLDGTGKGKNRGN